MQSIHKDMLVNNRRAVLFCSTIMVMLMSICAPFAGACNVPVFRYALERWPVAPYLGIVVSEGKLSKTESAALKQLNESSNGKKGTLNLSVRQFQNKELTKSSLSKSIPVSKPGEARIHLLFPMSTGITKPLWSGDLTAESVKKITDSPFRDSLAKKIIAGDSGVFILLECGDKKVDDAAAAMLDKNLAELSKVLKLPDGVVEEGEEPGDAEDFDPINQLRSPVPLRLNLSSLRLSRKKKDEVLVSLLMSMEDDLAEYKGMPMVFAVYGRGRVVVPLIGKGITTDNLGEIATFLTGPCSCQVKALNPGVDLLMNYDWQSAVLGED